jgi:hypothetical protein
MRSLVSFLGVILVVWAGVDAAPAARAAEGLYLTWNECELGPGASHDRVSPCDNNLGEQALYCAFRLPAPADSVLGVEIVVDLQHADPVLPDWWRFGVGACRAGNLRADFDFTAQSGCADFFFGNAAGGLQGYYVTEPRGGLNQARIKLAASLLPSFGYAELDSINMYYAGRLTITNAYTVLPPFECPGCTGPACLVFNSMIIHRQPGAVGGDVFLSVPGPGNANWATWQGTGADCAAVPVRAVTWGRLKSLYR